MTADRQIQDMFFEKHILYYGWELVCRGKAFSGLLPAKQELIA